MELILIRLFILIFLIRI